MPDSPECSPRIGRQALTYFIAILLIASIRIPRFENKGKTVPQHTYGSAGG
jgi:hypothetical protein